MKKFTIPSLALVACLAFSSCSSTSRGIREPETKVEFYKKDFNFTAQVSAEAQSTKILGIDFSRLFTNNKYGAIDGASSKVSLSSIPVVGNLVSDKTSAFALYNLMEANPGYDVIFYPQYETKVTKPILGIGLLTKITNVKVSARLGSINSNTDTNTQSNTNTNKNKN